MVWYFIAKPTTEAETHGCGYAASTTTSPPSREAELAGCNLAPSSVS